MLDAENILLQRFSTKGDPEAFSEIVRRHADLVYGACWRVLQDRDKASDVVQDTFLQLLHNAGSITGSVPAWLHRVATNKAIDLMRKDGARRRQEKDHAAEQPMTVNSWDDISPYVDEEMNRLDDQTREVLIQHFFEGHTTRDIGAIMRISQATVSRRLESGVVMMREGLRRRGVIVAIPLLISLLGGKAAEAAPAFLLRELGKMAIVGAQTAMMPAAATFAAQAAAGGLLTGVKLKVLTVAAVAAVGMGSVATYVYVSGLSKSKQIAAAEEDQLDPARKKRLASTGRAVLVSSTQQPPMVTLAQQELPQPAQPIPGPNNTSGQTPSEVASGNAEPNNENTQGDTAMAGDMGGIADSNQMAQDSNSEQTNDQQMFYGGMGSAEGTEEEGSAEPNEGQGIFIPEL
jgi:RNA polymerase sigma-70 factor (ECF subfamily)